MSTRCVLIIDDEDDIREVAQISLETMASWDVLTAASGPEGVKLAETEQPDLILLDLMMPAMDGFSTLQVLQNNSRTQHIPVIFLTAKVRSRLIQDHSHALSAVGVITKPFNAIDLADQISEIVGW